MREENVTQKFNYWILLLHYFISRHFFAGAACHARLIPAKIPSKDVVRTKITNVDYPPPDAQLSFSLSRDHAGENNVPDVETGGHVSSGSTWRPFTPIPQHCCVHPTGLFVRPSCDTPRSYTLRLVEQFSIIQP